MHGSVSGPRAGNLEPTAPTLPAMPKPGRLHRRDDDARSADAPSPREPLYILDRAAVRAVDRAAVEEYGIPGIVLMENASRGLASAALRILARRGDAPGSVLVICGRGNNGGDGYALARHLHNAGHRLLLAPLAAPRDGTDAATNRRICGRMELKEIGLGDLDAVGRLDLVVDAMFGTGLDREITGDAADVVSFINRGSWPVLSVDVPSGLDCDTGRPLGVTVRADMTVTFVGQKPGFTELDAQPFVGDVVVADIGVPIELVRRHGRPSPSGPPDPHPRE